MVEERTAALTAEITERTQAEAALRVRARQQAAVVELGQRALADTDLSALTNEAVVLVAQTIETEYCCLFELLPDGSALLLRAGVGWQDGRVGHATVEAGTRSQAGYVLLSNEPVIVEDLLTETRFSAPHILLDHGVLSGVSVIIQSRDRPFGVLGAHTRRHRTFTQDDIHFLQAIANVLAMAIERKRFEAQLEAMVEDRTRELQAANVRLEAASRHKSEFLANMSHELRTPLNSIIGFSELLQDPTFGPLIEKQGRYVDHIHKSGKHLLALINDLLDLSKVEAGKLELRPEAFELGDALAAALTEIRPQAEAKRLQLELQVDPALVTLTADPLRFKQILYNLLSNAVKFTPDGGRVTVSARIGSRGEGLGFSEGSRLDPKPSTLYPGEFVELAVADTGIGIQPEDLPRLFQPFTQLKSPFVKRHEGTGLGLALTKRLVELHGGQICGASEGEGRGSTFTVRLPLAPRS
jgi:signal transduction histidine kinase